MMKKLLSLSLSVLMIALFTLTSCNREEKTYLGTITVKLNANSEFPDVSVADIDVELTNTADNITRTEKTNAAGEAIFAQIPVGVYTVNTSVKITASLSLNGVAQNVVLAPNEIKVLPVNMEKAIGSDNFIIKEVFFAGKQDYDQKDRFFEIFNNSDKVLYADGLHFADLAGATGSDANDAVLGLPLDEYLYAMRVAKIPGNGSTYAVQPGKSIVIAFNAINFKEGFNPGNWAGLKIEDYLDLSTADFEMNAIPFLESKGFTGNTWFDVDNPSVPDVEILYMFNAGNMTFFRLNDYGPGLVIFRPEQALDITNTILSPLSTPNNPMYFLKIPVKYVIDGVDILDNSSAAKFKRMDGRVDAGFTFLKADGNAFYSGMSIRRKVADVKSDRKVLMDTNNSTNDFEAITRPTPKNY